VRHLTIQQLSATVDDALSGVSLELVRRHLVECEECRQRGMRLSRIDAVMAQLVSHDPGDDWFTALAGEIAERVDAEVGGRFDPPAHPAGPPPLEVVARSGPLSPEQLDAIWEEGSTTPRPAITKSAEATDAGAAAATPPVEAPTTTGSQEPTDASCRTQEASGTGPRIEDALIPDEPSAWQTPRPSAPKRPAPAEPATTGDATAKPAPTPAESTPAEPPWLESPRPMVRPRPAPALAAKPVSPAASKNAPAPRPATPAEGGSRWGVHAERVARARRAEQAPRETLFPLTLGLVGGAVAGGLIVTLFFVRPIDNVPDPVAPAAATHAAKAPAAAVTTPIARPVFQPVAPAADSVTDVEPNLAAPPVTLPHSPSLSAPARTSRAAAARATKTERTPPAPAARAVPTDEESWPLLCGEIVDETGAPVAGARVLLADLDVGARTDRRGRFCLSAPPGDRTLSVVALGFATQRRTVSVAAGAADLHLVLKPAP